MLHCIHLCPYMLYVVCKVLLNVYLLNEKSAIKIWLIKIIPENYNLMIEYKQHPFFVLLKRLLFNRHQRLWRRSEHTKARYCLIIMLIMQ